ncbi:UDP-N-acetylmuramoyl-tripeptide--D-alanyl-D-alanine ligase [Iodidimonas gelatinilytica]|uniref:UDP-N-acetylmuramoyl-tripeptide--D-alanyl-D-alanine ligase n=1 Tax=Iodidimonas gelatinilytica TaxID=1236966 RepID=A0A5A7N0J4_9PROT|nr:UDP-N-acetylmuramoyl-tripeptide--D-alanyl-D-alanine ligase [Iodidimonas gelatinilytica]GER01773.1 UDP-N-acetylmuramoyl-tripeptide--D-alanyl-D-alanine ligase [Iodidimonas gelatinilytica]
MNIREPLWTAQEIRAVLGAMGASRWYADGIAIDSRDLVPGDLFIALDGPNHDGHDYVAQAFAAGAVGAIVSKAVSGVADDDPRLVKVDDGMAALYKLAAAARARMTGKVAVVTGSAGKTSVKDMLRLALGRERLVHASIRSFNNHLGAPLSLARMPRETAFAVFELGMSAAGEIAPLSRLMVPDLAIVTGVGKAHAQAFDSLEQIADAKAEIFAGLTPGGMAVLGMDHDQASRLVAHAKAAKARLVTVSMEETSADVGLVRYHEQAQLSCFTARLGKTLVTGKIGAGGRHWVANALLVLAAVRELGGDLGLAALALADFRPAKGRGVHRQIALRDGPFTLIDDAYNANPLSFEASLAALALAVPGAKGRRLGIFADMVELGADSASCHQPWPKRRRQQAWRRSSRLAPKWRPWPGTQISRLQRWMAPNRRWRRPSGSSGPVMFCW